MKKLLIAGLLFILLHVVHSIVNSAIFDYSPKSGSTAGGTKLTIYGSAFSMKQTANANQVFIGGKVCQIVGHAVSSSVITCITPPGIGPGQIRILVDNLQYSICNYGDCTYWYDESSTPYFSAMVPAAVAPSSQVSFSGRLLTNQVSQITDLKVGQHRCSTQRVIDSGENIALNNNYGKISCDLPRIEAGFYNTSMKISPYGDARQLPESIMFNPIENKSYNIEIFPEVQSLSSHKGSKYGGTLLHIAGQGFSEKTQAVSVEIDGSPCNVISTSYNQIACITTPGRQFNATEKRQYRGNRGLKHEVYLNLDRYVKDAAKYPNSPDQVSVIYDLFESPYVNWNSMYGQRLSGIFTPVTTGNHTFVIASDDYGDIKLSPDMDPSKATVIAYAYWTPYRLYDYNAEQRSKTIFLEKGKHYYIEASVMEWYGDDYLSVGVVFPYDKPSVNSVTETQKITTKSDWTREAQKVVIKNAAEGWFRLRLGEKSTLPLFLDATADQVRDAMYDKLNPGYLEVALKKPDAKTIVYEILFGQLNFGNRELLILDDAGLEPINETIPVVTEVVRTKNSSEPIAGTFEISIFNTSLIVPYNIDAWNLQERLRAVPQVKEVSVRAYGTYEDGAEWLVKFTGIKGAVPIMHVQPIDLTGENVQLSNVRVVKGSYDVWAAPFPLTQVSTLETTPQVRVTVNNSPAACKGDCSFKYLATSTLITSVEPQFGGEGTNITIAGVELQNVDSVVIGETFCKVFSQDSDTIQCTVGQVPAGENDLFVVTEAGASNPLIFTGVQEITNIIPSTGSLFGGQVITISGYGFAVHTNVSINSIDCSVTSATYDKVICITPENIEPLFGADFVEVGLVVQTNRVSSVDTYTYAESSTPVITLVTPFDISALEVLPEITLEGYGFSSNSTIEVFVGDSDCIVSSVTSEVIKCNLAAGSSGDLSVRVYEQGAGYANGTFTISRKFQINSISPVAGSIRGGTLITIEGEGLVYSPDLKVFIGEGQCTIVDGTTDDHIKCITPRKGYPDQFDVLIQVKDAVSECKDVCLFEYSEELTPIVTSFSPETGSEGETITIEGWMLGAGSVKIGTAECKVIEANETTVTCTLGAGEAGPHDVVFHKDLVGFAAVSSDLPPFTYVPRVDTISPKIISIAGARLTITGMGFTSTIENFISIADRECAVVSSNLTQIICDAKPYPGINVNDVLVSVRRVAAVCSDSCTIEYSEAATPTIAKFWKSGSISGAQLVFEGQNLGTSGKVVIGTKYSTKIIAYNSTTIVAKVPDIPAGLFDIVVFVDGQGFPVYSVNPTPQFESALNIDNIDGETVGSIAGGSELILYGQGFPLYETGLAETQVLVCGRECEITSYDYNTIECKTKRLVNVDTMTDFKWKREEVLKGQVFGSGDPESGQMSYSHVFDDKEETYFTSGYGSRSNCNLGIDLGALLSAIPTRIEYLPRSDIVAGTDRMNGIFQASNNKKTWDDLLKLNADMPTGWNFADLNITQSYRYFRYKGGSNSYCSASEIKFLGYVLTNSTGDCPVTVTVNSKVATIDNGFKYSNALTPTISEISPSSGTAAGGTYVTITGSGFGSENITVVINGVPCLVDDFTNTSIICMTGERTVFAERSTIEVTVAQKGLAAQPDNVIYTYIDRWSAKTTWGNQDPPRKGESVQIPKGQTILLDISPPELLLIVIEGTLIFEDQQDLELVATYIFVKGGKLQIGTESEPFEHTATITLKGTRDVTPEIPIYGAKVLALRGGLVEMHGLPRKSWVKLGATANAGDDVLVFASEMDWNTGDRLVIAPTDFDIEEVEELTVVERINSTSVRIDTPLKYLHYGEIQQLDEFTIDTRAEVGLLSRNVIFQGDQESIADEFGAHFMIHSHGDDSSVAKISNCEFRFVGQAFRLGRYPIHYHMIGRVQKSYVKNNAIHHTYNRAIAIHGVHYLRVHDNVGYRSKGHMYFVEDGIETNNELIRNLGIMAMPSSSLLNTDTSPAVFWTTNPHNIWIDNAAAASPNYGFWFDLVPAPTGASAGNDHICSSKMTLGKFSGNSAHTVGRYGLRIFEGFDPRLNCGSTTVTAVFDNFTGWKCGRLGAIATIIGDVRFNNFKVTDNIRGGMEVSMITDNTPFNSPMITSSVVAAYSQLPNKRDAIDAGGIVTPRTENFRVENTTFFNFDTDSLPALFSCSKCEVKPTENQGGYTIRFRGLSFRNSPYRTKWNTPFKDIYLDEDGSLTGIEGGWAVSDWSHNRAPACNATEFYDGLVCDSSVQFRKISLTNFQPTGTYNDKDIFVVTDYGTSRINFKRKNFQGWVVPVILNNTVSVFADTWVDWNEVTVTLSNYQPDNYFYFRLNNTEYRDHFEVAIANNNDVPESNVTLTPTMPFGTHYKESNNSLSVLMKGTLTKPLSSTFATIRAKRCSRAGCPTPPKEQDIKVGKWSSPDLWGARGIPQEGEDVVIKPGWTVTLDVSPPKLKTLTIQGRLYVADQDVTLQATFLFIQNGTFAIGSEENPFKSKATIILQGTKSTYPLLVNDDLDLGSKVIANFGNLKLYGNPRTVYATRAAKTALANQNKLTVAGQVDWVVGDVIAIGTTSSSISESETATIAAVELDAGNTVLTLASPLQFRHYGDLQTIAGKSIDVRAVVTLLTRNVVITGTPTTTKYGCHVYNGFFVDQEGSENVALVEISDVQFANCGQFDSTRHQIAFGPGMDSENSFVRRSSFSDGYNTAIAVLEGVSGVKVLENTIYKTIMSSIITHFQTSNNEINGNIVYGTVLRPRTHPDQVDILASFDVRGNQIIKNNIAIGSEDMGFITEADSCGTTNLRVTNNQAYATLVGFFLTASGSGCLQLSNFFVSKARDFGVVSFIISDIVLKKGIVVDSRIGVNLNNAMRSTSQYLSVADATFVGESDNYVVGEDCYDRAGVMSFTYVASPKILPVTPISLPWNKIKSDPTVWGKNTFSGIIFANYRTSTKRACTKSNDRAFITNPLSPDVTLPHIFEKVTLSNVDENAKLYLDDPNPEWKNNDDCGDMDCEGLKQTAVLDIDGSFSGSVGGSYISNNPTLADPARCTLNSKINAYKCASIPFQVLAIDSLDPDRMDRRVAPLLVTSNKTGITGYLNNPMDHVWHFDYTGQKRMTTFWPLVEANVQYDLKFTSTNPVRMRFYLLNAPSDEAIVVVLPYTNPNKLVIYNENGVYIEPSTTTPTISSKNGANIYEHRKRKLTFVVRGSRFIEINQIPVVQVQIRLDVSVEDFFADKFVQNLADSLGINPKNIRIVDIRRGSTIVDFEIVPDIPQVISTNTTIVDPISLANAGKMNVQEIREILVQKVTNNQLAQNLGYTILNFTAIVSENQVGNTSTNSTRLFNDPPEEAEEVVKKARQRTATIVTAVIFSVASLVAIAVVLVLVTIGGVIYMMKSRRSVKHKGDEEEEEYLTDIQGTQRQVVSPSQQRELLDRPISRGSDDNQYTVTFK